MAFFKNLPADAGVRHILAMSPQAGRALVEFHSAVLRSESELSPKEKELIAAYVSGLNACQYCYGVHAQTAQAFGIPEGLLEQLLQSIETADIAPKLKPILQFARKLTLDPSKMTDQDAQAVLNAGWTEHVLHEAVMTICLFNFMNRLLEGHGVKGGPGVYKTRGKSLQEHGYAPLLEMLKS
jgi:uncharacterized peroxidase-related enzyme